jgi:hypothetical protein
VFRIREATPEDHDALSRLEAQSPQGSGITIVADRDDYLYRANLHEEGKTLIAEEDGNLIGVMAYAIKDVFVSGERERVAYFYDLRAEASYRRSMRRGVYRLWRTTLEGMEGGGASIVYGHVKADNRDALSVFTKLGFERLSSFDVLSLPSLRGQPPNLDPHLHEPHDEIERIRSFVGPRNLTPYDFHAPYIRGIELGYLRGIFRIEEGDSWAQLSAWNVSRVCRGRVLRMPRSLRVLAHLLNPLSAVLPVPRIPRVGEPVTYLQLFDPLVRGEGGSRLLRELLQQLRRLAYSEGLGVLALFVYDDIAEDRLPTFFPQHVLRYDTMAWSPRGVELPKEPLYLDVRDV